MKSILKMIGLKFDQLFCCLGIALVSSQHTCSRNELEVDFGEGKLFCNSDDIPEVPIRFFDDNQGAPSIRYQNAEMDKLYTLLMVDPDAPGANSWLHWIVTNLNGENLSVGLSSEQILKENVVTEYNRPTPPPDHGPHHYYFVLCSQLAIMEVKEISTRANFDLRKFLNDNELVHVVAETAFVTERKK